MLGAPELIAMVLVVAMIAGGLFVLVRVIARIGKGPRKAGLAHCCACNGDVSPRPSACPHSGEPAGA